MNGRTISQLAKECGVNVETIRFYQRCGILSKPPAPAEGWREYSDAAVETVRYIKQGQQLGFSLAEIKRLEEKAGGRQLVFCESVRAATREKIWAVEEQIKQLRKVRKELMQFLARCSAKKENQRCPIFQSLLAMKLNRKGVVRA
jgi:MerR family mercuric resistance operon transcriptional regulator